MLYYLIAIAGSSVATSSPTVQVGPVLNVPDSGATFIWESVTEASSSAPIGGGIIGSSTTSSTAISTQTWTILSHLPDSASWTRIRIHETVQSTSQANWDREFDLRLLDTGESSLTTPPLSPPTPDESWRNSTSDSILAGGGRLRILHQSTTVPVTGSIDATQMTERILPSGTSDSLYWSQNHKAGGLEPFEATTAETVTRVLLSANGTVLRTIGQSAISRIRQPWVDSELHSLFDMIQVLSAHPASIVRVTDLAGRSHTYSASEASIALPSLHGVLLVELREGGSELRGRLLLP